MSKVCTGVGEQCFSAETAEFTAEMADFTFDWAELIKKYGFINLVSGGSDGRFRNRTFFKTISILRSF